MANIGVIASSWKASAVGVIARLEPPTSTHQLYPQKGMVFNPDSQLYLMGVYYDGSNNRAWAGSINNSNLNSNYHNTYATASGSYQWPQFLGAVVDFDNNITSTYAGGARSAQVSVGRTSTTGIAGQSTNADAVFNTTGSVDYGTVEQAYYLAGWYDGTGRSMCVKRNSGYNPSNAVWFDASGQFNYFHNVAARQAAAGGVFAVGDIQTNPRVGHIWYGDSSLNTVWIRGIAGGSGTVAFLEDVVHDTTSDSAVAVGWYQSAGVIASWSRSSGSINWQNGVGSAGGSLYSMGWDSTDNMFYAGSSNGHIFKFNSSGVIQWQRRLTCSNGNSLNFDCAKIIFRGSDYIIAGRVSVAGGGQNTIILRMPKDGSGSGGSRNLNGLTFTYTTTTVTIASEGLTNTTPSFSRNTFTASNNTTPHTRTTLAVTNTTGAI